MPLCGRDLAAALGLGDEILQEHHLSFYVLGVENLAWMFEYQFSFVKMRRRDVHIRKVAGAAGVSALGLLFLALHITRAEHLEYPHMLTVIDHVIIQACISESSKA